MALAAPSRRTRNPIAAEDQVAGWIFLLPALIIFAVFIIGPILYVFWLSFHQWSVIPPQKPWVGLANYRQLFQNNPDFDIAFRNTAWFSIGVVPTQTIL